MKEIKHFMLPDHTNKLYENEAISSISLTRNVAEKINELVDAYNEVYKWNYEKHQEQDGRIRKGILYMKDNLLNSLNDLMEIFKDSGFIDDRIEYHCKLLQEQLDNLIGSITDGSTTLDAELIDLRLDAMGKAHKTAGTSIRKSIGVLLDHTKNLYLESIKFYDQFSNVSWSLDDAYNRIANTDLFNLSYDILVSAPCHHEVSVTIWKEGKLIHDTGWNSSVIVPKGFDSRLCLRKSDDTAVDTGDIYKCTFSIDEIELSIPEIASGLSYTSGGAYTGIRLNSGKFEVDKLALVSAPEGFSVALKLYKEKADGSHAQYKDTGWTSSVTLPIGYICELSFKKNDDSRIFKSDLEYFTFRYGAWNETSFSSINESIFREILNSVTYGGWTTETYTYNDTTFTRMISGIFISDQTLKIKSRNPNSKIALHLWQRNELGPDSFISASSWMSETIIPANRYFTLYFSGDSANAIMQLSDLECYTLQEYSEPSSSGSGVYANDNINSVAHMGYSLEAPENTLSAYKLAHDKGFKYVECDVSFTSDNIGVLLHDSTIDRTSNGSGKISEMTFEEVRRYDFGSWMGNKYTGEQIPSFEEFIRLCRNLGLHPYIEIKYGANQSQVESLVQTVNKNGMKGKVTYISFETSLLSYVHNADPAARLGYVVNNVTSETITAALNLRSDNDVFIDCNYANANDDAVSLCISSGFPMEVWTVDDESIIKNMNPYVSGFTSNYIHSGSLLMSMY